MSRPGALAALRVCLALAGCAEVRYTLQLASFLLARFMSPPPPVAGGGRCRMF